MLPGEHAVAWGLFSPYLSLYLDTGDGGCMNGQSRSPASRRTSVFIGSIKYSYWECSSSSGSSSSALLILSLSPNLESVLFFLYISY